MKRLILSAMLCLVAPTAAFAGPALDAVKFFYAPLKYEADPQYRDRFSGPAKALFDRNDQTPEGEPGCIDFAPGVDAEEFDEATVARTVKLAERMEGETATVTATFDLAREGENVKREMLWTLQREGDAWKITDIASVTNGWKLSDLHCRPEN